MPTATETEKRQSTVQGVARQTGHTLPSKTAVALEDEDGELIPTGRKKTVAERPAPSNRTYNPQQRTVREAAAPAGREISSLPRHTEKKEDAPHKKDSPSAPWSKKKEKAEQKAETKDKKKNKVKSGEVGADVMANVTKALIYMVIVTAISVLLAVIVIRVGNDIFAFVKGTDEITVTIPEEAGVAQVADILGDNGIINYPSIFKLYCSLKKERGDFLAGEYTVTPSMSYERLRNEFKEQPVTGTCWVTIPEGYTVDDIIDLMVENKIGTREKYIEVINTYDFDFWFIDELEEKGVSSDRSYRLEGYLFPDTYEFYNSSSEEMVIKKLLKRFEEVYGNDFKAKAEEKGYTTDQVLTIASYIQKEAKNTGDYMYVSSVIDNRLKSASFPHLELDATIIYAIRLDTGEKKTSVSHEDTEYNSPYNTYICNGLTPGPITNPGANAIRFALYPTESTYYYYVSDNYGKIYFASNEAEHNRNIETVRKINES